jgi:hypothetical protein
MVLTIVSSQVLISPSSKDISVLFQTTLTYGGKKKEKTPSYHAFTAGESDQICSSISRRTYCHTYKIQKVGNTCKKTNIPLDIYTRTTKYQYNFFWCCPSAHDPQQLFTVPQTFTRPLPRYHPHFPCIKSTERRHTHPARAYRSCPAATRS